MQSWFTPTVVREILQLLFLKFKVTFYLPQGGFPPSVAQLICTFLTVDKWQMCWVAFYLKPSRELIPEHKNIYKVSVVHDSSSHRCAGLCPISKSSRTKNNYLLKDIGKLTEDLFRKALECWDTEKQKRWRWSNILSQTRQQRANAFQDKEPADKDQSRNLGMTWWPTRETNVVLERTWSLNRTALKSHW